MTKIRHRYNNEVIIEGEGTIKELVLLAIQKGLNLSSADLSSADLSSADLSSADLRRADLIGADLSSADLSSADLRRADLRRADLRRADLSSADLRGADLDFASWPLWCGSLTAKLDERLKAQLLYHVIAVVGADSFPQELIDRANTFHRVGEVPAFGKGDRKP